MQLDPGAPVRGDSRADRERLSACGVPVVSVADLRQGRRADPARGFGGQAHSGCGRPRARGRRRPASASISRRICGVPRSIQAKSARSSQHPAQREAGDAGRRNHRGSRRERAAPATKALRSRALVKDLDQATTACGISRRHPPAASSIPISPPRVPAAASAWQPRMRSSPSMAVACPWNRNRARGLSSRIDLPASQSAAAPEAPRRRAAAERHRQGPRHGRRGKPPNVAHSRSDQARIRSAAARATAPRRSTCTRPPGSGRGFDVVLLDLTVKCGMGGVETAARLKELDPSVKLIASSGYSDAPVMSASAGTASTGCCRSRGLCRRSANCSGGSWPPIPSQKSK